MRTATAVQPIGPWHPLAAAEVTQSFLDTSRVERDGAVVLGGESGGWLRIYPVEPGPHLLRGQVQILGDGSMDAVQGSTASSGATASGAVPVATVHVAQFAHPVTVDEVRSDTAARQAVQIATLRSSGQLEVAVDVKAGSRCLAVAVHSPASDVGSAIECRVSDVRLARSGFAELLVSAAEKGGPFDPRSSLPTGAFEVGMIERPSMALAPGSEVTFELGDVSSAVSVEAMVALSSLCADPPEDRVRFVCDVVLDDGQVVQSTSQVLELLPAERNGWVALEVPLPAESRGEALRLRFSTERLSGASLVLPLISTPRIVSTAPERLPNLLVVSIDTLRADHVGAYGYGRDTTPCIDALAGEALVFRDCWAQSSYTLPSHMSLFSGQLPSRHGVAQAGDRIDRSRTTLLAEILSEQGYSTAAFTGGGFVDPKFGFARGFEQFGTFDPVLNPESARVRAFLDSVPGVASDAIEDFSATRVVEWIERRRDERFFVFFHTYAPHDFDAASEYHEQLGLSGGGLSADSGSQSWLAHPQYRPQRPIRKEEVARLIGHYDAAIRAADDAVGEILEGLRRLNLWEDTIVVVTSDHGKELGERGQINHGHSLYEELLQVPLIVRIPGREHALIEEPAMLVDVVPTVLSQLGLSPPAGIQGRDLLAPGSPRPLFAELDHHSRLSAFREGARKVIYRPARDPLDEIKLWQLECYDLDEDPAESASVAPAAFAPRARTLRAYLQELAEGDPSEERGSAELPEELRHRLRVLGYDF